jgi:hypothetical protein
MKFEIAMLKTSKVNIGNYKFLGWWRNDMQIRRYASRKTTKEIESCKKKLLPPPSRYFAIK